MSSIFQTKPIEQLKAEAEGHADGMQRTLGAWNLTFLGVGAIIGAGIFSLVGAASQMAGPAIILSFVLAALGCAFAGLCYAEFASMIPVAGSAYVYAYATMGEIVAFVIGWALTLEYAFGASTVAVSWSGYLVSLLKDYGVIIPPTLTNAAGTVLPDGSTAIFNLPAVIIIFLLSAVLYRGIGESAKLNNIIVIIKTTVIIGFILAGIAFIQGTNFSPFIPENTGKFGELGWSGILAGAATIFFAYIGFDAVSTAAQETKNPEKNMPIGILASLAICTVIYILVAVVLIGLVPYPQLGVPDPIAVGINAVPQLSWLRLPIKLGALAGLTSVMLVMMLGQTRIWYSMGKDGLLPNAMSRLHPKFKSPMLPTVLTAVAAALLAGLLPIVKLGHLVSMGTLLAFAIVCAGVLILRYTRPDIPRPFRTPLVPLVPVLGILVSLALMVGLQQDALVAGGAWLVVGVLIYFAYGQKNSMLKRAPGQN